MSKFLASFLILLSLFSLSACTMNKDVKEKSRNVDSNKTDTPKEVEEPNADEILIPKEYFTVVQSVNGKNIIQNPDNICLLVNTTNYLSETFIPSDLVIPDVEFSFKEQNVEKNKMRETAATALEELFNASKANNLQLVAVSGYRSYKRQQELFSAEVSAKGEVEAERWVARPGTSEHQSGLSMDVSSVGFGNQLEQSFDQTKEFNWLAANAHKFGFILRYPQNKEDVTKHAYEPWHYRFVGVDVATEIYKRGICLEEFISNAKPL